MSYAPPSPVWPRALAALAICLALAACGGAPEKGDATWLGRSIGPPPEPNPGLKRVMIARATSEWEFFGRQTVVYQGSQESIPNVGAWEDDDSRYSTRVNAYWRAVGKPGLTGMDCQKPWSAAFLSWVMQGAGVPETQFRPAAAHWIYVSAMIDEAPLAGRWFVPRRIADYSPNPGDLICASRSGSRPLITQGYTDAWALEGTGTHCDLVVAKNGRTLEAIGGNVRNSVSKSTLELDAQGRLQPVPRRPWFLVLQNRL